MVLLHEGRNEKNTAGNESKMKKKLYVSDLDGTLLQSNERTSDFTNGTINRLTEDGLIFSYATARSFHTSRKVTAGLDAKIPVIVYNGAFILDNVTHEILVSNFFDGAVNGVLDDFFAAGIFPIIYSFIDGMEKFSYVPELSSKPQMEFIATRKGDVRDNPVQSREDLKKGNLFYITCIDSEEKLAPFFEKYRDSYHCVFQKDIYSGEQWLEIMPQAASKSNAARQLKEFLHCDYVVAFGDGKNDIDLFEIADESYAVENAVPELKAAATGVIASNNEDGVAKWLLKNFRKAGAEKIVRAQENDFSVLRDFYDKVIDESPEMEKYARWKKGMHPADETIKNYIASSSMYIVWKGEKIAAAFALTMCQGEDYHPVEWHKKLNDAEVSVLHILAVNPEFQGMGLGKKTVMAAMEIAENNGRKSFRLDALASNIPARKMYESLGFEFRGTQYWFAKNTGWTDFVLYEHDLPLELVSHKNCNF